MMKKFFIILNFFLFSVFLSSFSNAEECDFYDLKIGDSSVKAKNIFGEIKNEDHEIEINYIETSFSIICPDQGVEDASVKIFIIGERIAGYFIESYTKPEDSKNKEKLIYYYVKKNYAKYAKVSDLNWKGGAYWTMSDGRELFYNKNLKQNGIISEDLLITNLEFSKHF